MAIDSGEELGIIFEQLKNQLNVNHDMGLDTPILTKASLEYLKKGVALSEKAKGSALSDKAKGPGTLEELRTAIGDCSRCGLGKGRTNLVFGEGAANARLMFVGEGPGRDEDIEGRPFVGEAGKLLTKIIGAMGLKREDVYICNVVKCRPPDNRTPKKDEITTCMAFLKKQIELIKPEIICTLGNTALQSLIKDDLKITRERGKWLQFNNIPLMPTYHPAYLLRTTSAKRPVWEDVKLIMNRLGLKG